MSRLIITLIILYVFYPVQVNAVIVPGLYEAEIEVPDQSNNSYNKGVKDALIQILIKLTGDRNVLGRQVTAYLMQQPDRYVQQYKYHNRPIIEDNQLSIRNQLVLWVSFNANALNKELRDYGVPLWGDVRPSTLIWLAIQDKGERRLTGIEDPSGYTNILDNCANKRGIVLDYPILDAEDNSRLKATDVWGGFSIPVMEASGRYPADTIMSGRVSALSNDKWEGEWMVLLNGETIRWTVNSNTVNSVLEESIDRLADFLAEKFIQITGYSQESGFDITVNDIREFDEYSRVLKYLTSLHTVTRVNVKSVRPDSITFALTSAGDDTAIRRAIELGRTLESISGSGNQYRLLP